MKEIKTYIINLKSSVDRKKRITENLKGLSFLDYSFIEAVDGRSMTHDEIIPLILVPFIKYTKESP